MIFTKTKLEGSFIIEPEKVEDERGFFARSWDKKIFEESGLNSNLVQCNISFNKKKGTIRGLHYQTSPYEEAKLVRCTKGKVFEVMIDLRSKSETFMNWLGIELTSENYRMLYVPEGFALGLQTLEDNSELFYQMSQIYIPEYSRGIRWDDKTFRISWPLKPTIISKKDLSYGQFNELE
jgi:dTDP-4-dehydrorhamnose 3,5-epimerase